MNQWILLQHGYIYTHIHTHTQQIQEANPITVPSNLINTNQLAN